LIAYVWYHDDKPQTSLTNTTRKRRDRDTKRKDHLTKTEKPKDTILGDTLKRKETTKPSKTNEDLIHCWSYLTKRGEEGKERKG
jgi:hypothetical protein